MKTMDNIGLEQVQGVYNGPEGALWELIMGEQIHIGGFASSMDLAERAGVGSGLSGVDLCCCNGAGMRFLVRFREVARMHGVDATETVVEQGRDRKVRVFKHKRRKHYRRTRGHRQSYTAVKIERVEA